MYLYIQISKNTLLYKHTFWFEMMIILRANISVSIEASLLMLIIGFPRITFSICPCLDLKNAHLCMPISGSLNMLPHIPSYCGLQGNSSPNAYIWDSKSPSLYACIRVSIGASLYMPILEFSKISISICLYLVLKGHLCKY